MSEKKQYIIGVDVGGTKMSAGLFRDGKVFHESALATPKDNLNHFFIMMEALVGPLKEKAREEKAVIIGMGVGIPGVLSKDRQTVLKCPNVSILDNVKLTAKAEERFGLPVKMDNDTNCFARAECVLGAGKGYDNVFGVIVGTGIGGGWWLNGKIFDGAHGAAGEPGRMIVNFQEPIGIEAAYHQLMQRNPERMADEAYRGDVLAEKSFEELGRFLGFAFANIANIVDPEMFVVGGGAIYAGDLFLPSLKQTFKDNVMSADAKKIKILRGKIGTKAGIIGAALLFG